MIRKYVPELRHFDKKYIYEPQKAPIADQKAWGCLIVDQNKQSAKHEVGGGDSREKEMATYPKQMFDFDERRKICIDGMKHAYDVKMYGDDERVMSGEWRQIFDYPSEAQTNDMKVKDETNGEPVEGERQNGGKKRGRGGDSDRNQVEEENGDDDEKIDVHKRKSSAGTGGRGKQRKIDTMVNRRKT